MKRLVDQEARQRATADFRTNLVVTAGAGTGKTSLLVERILNGCLGEGHDLPRVVAITFTEKAAAEMRDRLSSALERILALARCPGSPDGKGPGEAERSWEHLRNRKGLSREEIASRARTCLERLDEAVVSTIHALCADLLRRYPREAGVDPAFRVDEGSAANRLSERVWEEWLAGELGPEGGRTGLWELILGELRIGSLRRMGREFARTSPPVELKDLAGQRRLAESILKDRAGELHGSLRGILERQSGMNPNLKAELEARLPYLETLAEKGPSELPRGNRFPAPWRPRSPGKNLRGVSPGEVEEEERRSRELLVRCSEIGDFPDRLLELLGPYAEAFRAGFAAEGYLSFSDLLFLARNLLRDHPSVREREKRRIRSILVDEFQDTDPLQYEIVFFLSEAEGSVSSNAFDSRLAPGKLFIVGDPKQSIYRFRGADIEAYRLAVGRIRSAGGAVLPLASNFRSPEEILSPLDVLFRKAFLGERPEQAEYERIVASQGKRGGPPRVAIWSVPPMEGRKKVEQLRRQEGRAIADWIRETIRAGGWKYRDIAILFQAMTAVDLYLRPLREIGIPFVVEGGRTFGGRPEVRLFLSLLKVLANPNDEVALLAVLRSPIGGVTDVELARHAAAGGRWSLTAAVDPGRCPNVARTIRRLQEARGRIRAMPADAAVRAVMEETHLLELNAAAYEGSQRVANLLRLSDRVAIRAREENLSLFETVRGLEREMEEGELEEGESPLADEALDAVRVMTVHKAKGLEFPVVIVPDLARRPNPAASSRGTMGWAGIGGGRRGFAVRVRLRSGTVVNAVEVVRREAAPRHDEAERIRSLYVACTRAKEHLILVAAPSRPAPWIDCLEGWGYSWTEGGPPPNGSFQEGTVRHEVHSVSGAPGRVQFEVLPPGLVTGAVRRFEEARRGAESRRQRRWLVSPTGLREAVEIRGEADGASGPAFPLREVPGGGAAVPAGVGAAAGIAVHRLLQVWDRRDPGWLRGHCREASLAGARETGRDPGEVEGLVREILDRFLASELPRRLQEAEVAGREVPFEAAEGDRLVRGMIDLIYRRGPEIVIADFKTDNVPAGREEELLAEYDEQMSVYGRAVQRALGLPTLPRREIWSVRTGRVVTYPPAER